MRRKNVVVLLGIISIPVIGIVLFALGQNQDVRSRAAPEEASVVVPTVVPAPKTILTSPYFRLVSTPQKNFSAGDQVPVEIFAATNGQQTSEARFVIAYDSSLLRLDEQGIQNGDVYLVLNVESVLPGKAIFSIFVNEEAGYAPPILSEEQKIATLFFHVIGKGPSESDVSMTVNPASDETTSLSLFTSDRSNPPQNILNSVEGTTISIQ